MRINHRKLLQIPQTSPHFVVVCRDGCGYHYSSSQDSPPTPQTPQYIDVDKSKANLPLSPIFTLLFCFLAGFLVLACYLALIRKYHLNLNNLGRRHSPDLDQNEDFINENHAPEFVHPIWFINSVGLQQSVIDSIAIFKYKSDEGLTEGTECSVCLSEFEEDESLRLLPKCSHAFHIPCIDTWLRSHKNCPMCRAPVVLDTNIAHLSTTDRNLNGLGLREEDSPDNNNNNGELGSQQVGEYRGEISEMGIGSENTSALAFPSEQENISEILDPRNCNGRVLSDLADHSGKNPVEELQPVRRSISMDSISASVIHFAVSNIRPMEHEASSKKLDTKKVAWQGNRSNSRKYGVMKSSSVGRSAHKRSGTIKRSLSTSGKCSRPRSRTESQDSILPL